MHTPTSKEPARAFARLRALFGRPIARGVLALCGLVVLSLVGRFAVAGGLASPAAASDAVASSAAPSAAVTQLSFAAVLPAAEMDAAVTPPPPAPASSSRPTRATADDPVYLNEATVDDLRRLPGVGDKRALAILELRRKLGRFHQVEDLLRVKGIGRSTLRKLRPLVRIDRPFQADGGGAS